MNRKARQTLLATLSYTFTGIGLAFSWFIASKTIQDIAIYWFVTGVIISFVFGIASYFILHHFLLDETREELERIKSEKYLFDFHEWDKLYDLLDEIERGDGEEDLRIMTSYFIDWVSIQQPLRRLLRKDVRIKILLMNPENKELVEARFGIRCDSASPSEVEPELQRQIKSLENDPLLKKIEVLQSDIMPSGFVVLTSKWIIFGFMPAKGPYKEGPMIRDTSDSDIWKLFDDDWKIRWEQKK